MPRYTRYYVRTLIGVYSSQRLYHTSTSRYVYAVQAKKAPVCTAKQINGFYFYCNDDTSESGNFPNFFLFFFFYFFASLRFITYRLYGFTQKVITHPMGLQFATLLYPGESLFVCILCRFYILKIWMKYSKLSIYLSSYKRIYNFDSGACSWVTLNLLNLDLSWTEFVKFKY